MVLNASSFCYNCNFTHIKTSFQCLTITPKGDIMYISTAFWCAVSDKSSRFRPKSRLLLFFGYLSINQINPFSDNFSFTHASFLNAIVQLLNVIIRQSKSSPITFRVCCRSACAWRQMFPSFLLFVHI